MRRYQQELIDLIADLGMYHSERLLNVHRTTIQRWMRGITRTPESAVLTLRAAVKGQLPGQTDLHWVGWKFGQDGNLYSPAGQAFHTGDLLAQQYERALIKAQRNEIEELKETVGRLNRIIDKFAPVSANDKVA